MSFNYPAFITLVLYGICLVGIGVWAARKSKVESDFLLAGRNLGPVMAGLAYAASTSSAWVLLGFSGFVYLAGVSALWMVPGVLVGYALVWLVAGPVLQRSSRLKGHLTLTDFLAEGAGNTTGRAIRIVASLMIAFCFAFYVASQFQGAAVALTGLFEIDFISALFIGAAIILIYTMVGGFLAVALIDTIQGLLMAVVAVLLPTAAFFAAGGFEGLSAFMQSASPDYQSQFGGRTGLLGLGFAFGLFAAGFGALGQPQLTAWIMASRDPKALYQGAAIALTWGAVVYTGMAVLGISARSLLGPGAEAEGVFFQIASDYLPAVFAGVIAAAALSAIMSTVDSQLIVAGAAVSHDLGAKAWFGGRAVLASRIAITLVLVCAITLTLTVPDSIFERVLFAWTALGASFGPVVLLRAMGQRPTGLAVLLSILLGFSFSLIYEFLLPAGPASVYARTIPWIVAFAPLFVLPRARSH